VVAEALARGDVDAEHARALTAVIEVFVETLAVADFEARLCAIEQGLQRRSKPT
jgi:hypothetical protein